MAASTPHETIDPVNGYYTLGIGLEMGIAPTEQPDDVVDTYEGDVLFHLEESDKPIQAGRFRAFRVRLGDAPEPFFRIFDAHSHELLQYWEALFNHKTDKLKQKIQDEYQVFQHDILILDMIQILPAHRGRGLGLAVASRLIETLGGGCGLVACKPFPLQLNPDLCRDGEFKAKMQLDEFERDEETAFGRIRKHWSKLGFERVGRSLV